MRVDRRRCRVVWCGASLARADTASCLHLGSASGLRRSLFSALIRAARADDWRIAIRLLIAWNVAARALPRLVLHLLIWCCECSHHIRRRARLLQDEGQVTILVLTAVAALASLGAIIALLGSADAADRSAGRAHSRDAHDRAVVGVHAHDVRAALRARILRRERRQGRRHAASPRDAGAGLLGFRLFLLRDRHDARRSPTCSVTLRADPPHRVRRTAIVSFIFNVALLALTVNIAASAI